MSQAIKNTLEVVVRFEIEVPMIVQESNTAEVAETVMRVVRSRVRDAFSELHEHFEVQVKEG